MSGILNVGISMKRMNTKTTNREVMSVGFDWAEHGSGKMVLEVMQRRESSGKFELLHVSVWGVDVPEGCLEVNGEYDAI